MVRLQKPTIALKVSEVVVVEGVWGGGVEIVESGSIPTLRAVLLQCGQVSRVQAWVRIARAAEVI